MTKERRRQLALAFLLLILVVFGGRRILSLLGADGTGRAASAGGRLFADGFSIAEVEPLLISELAPGADTFKLGRDPFQFAAPPPPTPAPTPPPTAAPNPAPPRPTVQPPPTPAEFSHIVQLKMRRTPPDAVESAPPDPHIPILVASFW